MNPSNAILIIAEHNDYQIHHVTYELMNKARQLSTVKDQKVHVLILGNQVKDLAQELTHYESDGVYYIDDRQLDT